jgi:hypothetical protein
MTDPHHHSHAEHGHDRHAHAHTHAKGAPTAPPPASMRWSVLSLSVFERVLLVVPMVVCLWLAVGWAVSS